MRSWATRHARPLGRVALIAAIVAVALPVVATVVETPMLFGLIPYPTFNLTYVVLVISSLSAAVGLSVGLAVWIMRAPGYHLGMTAVLVVSATIVFVGLIVLYSFLSGAAHSEMRR
jgi:hypothetical protein